MSSVGKRVENKFRIYDLPLIIGLVITWMALWREVSLMTLFSGIILSLLLTRLFYLPPVEIAGSFNVFYVLSFVVFFIWNVAKASISVAWLAVRPKKTPNSSIIKVQLYTRSDFIMTATGLTISLIPGSFIVEADRHKHILYLHVLGAETQAEIEKMRSEVWRAEYLLIRAVGNKSDKLRSAK